jgi:hypothetical protein
MGITTLAPLDRDKVSILKKERPMRQATITCLGAIALLALAGCGHETGSMTAASRLAPGLGITTSDALVASNTSRLVAPNTSRVIAPNTSRVASPEVAPTVTSSMIASDPQAALDSGPDDPLTLVAREETMVNPPSFKISDRVPYAVVVADRSAHTATISWATELPTRGLIEYGRSWGFDKHQYDLSYHDDVPAMFHKVTLTGLRRFTGYEFRVTAIDALGLKFPEVQRHYRTKFWSLR